VTFMTNKVKIKFTSLVPLYPEIENIAYCYYSYHEKNAIKFLSLQCQTFTDSFM
jgi:hypothetical protein